MIKRIISLSLLLLVLTGCRREQLASFSPNLLLPLLSGSLDLSNLNGDSVFVADANGAVSLANEYELYRANINDFFEVPDSERMNTLSLQTLKLADQQILQPVPLFLVWPPASGLNGQMAQIPAQVVTNTPPVDVDGSEFFQSATFRAGRLEIQIDNFFPVELQTLVFELRNKTDNTLIQRDTFKNIPPDGSAIKTIDLAGKTLYAEMQAIAPLIETLPSNGPVLINAADLTLITIRARDMRPESAVARFPAQNVLSADEVVVYDFGDAQIKNMKVKKGRVAFRVVSTIQEAMNVDYSIPYATINGQAFRQQFTVPAAPPGGVQEYRRDHDVTGYTIDLRGKDPLVKDTVNSFYNVLNVTIDSSGKETAISLRDSVYIYIALLDVEAEEAEGYFGQQSVKLGPEVAKLDIFKKLSGQIEPEALSLNLGLQNGIGAEAELRIQKFNAIRSSDGRSLALAGAPLASPFVINPALRNPFTPSQQYLSFSHNNSNILEVIKLLPNEIDYEIELLTNPRGNVNNYRDFLTSKSEIVATLGVEVPMSIKANEFSLLDTLSFDMSQVRQIDQIKEGKLNIITTNGFPFSIRIEAWVLDKNGTLLFELPFNQNTLQSAVVNPATRMVISPLQSVVSAQVDAGSMVLLRKAKYISFKATMNTPSATEFWKFYQHYKLNLNITGDFIYDANL